ncbi:L,D-transpeptidase family protein [Trinickia mobilis]|uniref:L,D-transpeptidase family protein n=1 Tax=Trinickia mobilis TaxID=2816356 RepID=UPI001A8ED564|nr:L,D-transpeptidase family protein [Trinickia mobilis]
MRVPVLKAVVVINLMTGLLAIAAYGYTRLAARYGSTTAPAMANTADQADAILVLKSEKRLQLLRDGVVLREYRISLGGNPHGHKQKEGDKKTPEGRYVIDWRNANSAYHLSLHISYPSPDDMARALNAGVPPGGNVMIHGLPNGWGFIGNLQRRWNWTNGCIALTDDDMREIWSLVPNSTPIDIKG